MTLEGKRKLLLLLLFIFGQTIFFLAIPLKKISGQKNKKGREKLVAIYIRADVVCNCLFDKRIPYFEK